MNPLSITLTIRPALNGWIIEQQIGEQKPIAHAATSAWGAVGELARLMAGWERMMAPFHERACQQPYASGIPTPETISATAPPLDTARIGGLVVADLAEADRDAARRLATLINTSGPTILRAATQTPEPPAARPQPVAAAPADPAPGEYDSRGPDSPRDASAAHPAASAQAPDPAAAIPGCAGADPVAADAQSDGPANPSPAAGGKIVWTPEREALLRALWPGTTPGHDVLAQINALAGKPVSNLDALQTHASKLGLRRPTGGRAITEAERARLRERIAEVRAARTPRGYQVVRRTLKDGTVREYVYPKPPPEPPAEPPPTVAEPPAEPPRSASGHLVVWTEQVLALAQQMYERGEPRDVILTEINKLAPSPITDSAFETRKNRLGWRRPRGRTTGAAIAPEPLTSEEVHQAREMLRRGKTAPDLADWFGGNAAWWQAWIEQQGSKAA